MNLDIIEGIELSPIVVVEKNGCIVWGMWVDEY